MNKALLSKTTYLKAQQCQKHLYLYKFHYNWQDPLTEEKKALFSRGIKVGLLARKLFPGGKDASPKKITDQATWVKNTQTLIEQGIEVIYEAAFIHQQVFVAVDMLVKKNNSWYAYEVKSSLKITNTYQTDAALQYYVISNQKINLLDFCLIHVNGNYIRENKLNLSKFFNTVSVLDFCISQKQKIETNIEEALSTLSKKSIPQINIGPHCFEPYTCDFKGYCWKHITDDSIFEIAGLSKKEQFELYDAGHKTLSNLSQEEDLNKLSKLFLQSKSQNTAVVDQEKLKKFLSQFKYPLFFIDFEAFMPAIPLFDGSSPFEFIPFQFSIHYKKEKNSQLQHRYFLAEAGSDPRFEFITNFIKNTEHEGTLLAFDLSGEKKVLQALAEKFPEYKDDIFERISRLKEMNTPFKDYTCYHHNMKNSSSLKSISSSLINKLNYKSLNIQNGNMASVKFEQLQHENDIFNISQIREDLMLYCQTDTFAMSKIFEWLENQAEN